MYNKPNDINTNIGANKSIKILWYVLIFLNKQNPAPAPFELLLFSLNDKLNISKYKAILGTFVAVDINKYDNICV